MSANASMMQAAHATTGAAVGLMAAIFLGGLALYLWARGRRARHV